MVHLISNSGQDITEELTCQGPGNWYFDSIFSVKMTINNMTKYINMAFGGELYLYVHACVCIIVSTLVYIWRYMSFCLCASRNQIVKILWFYFVIFSMCNSSLCIRLIIV